MNDEKRKVFLVEDDLAIIDVYTTVFKDSKIDLKVITLGRQAIKDINQSAETEGEKPEVVLLDLILPDLNGAEILKAIKTNEKTKDIKVFVLSNQAFIDETITGGIKPDEFIVKANITPTQLLEMIEKKLS